MHTRLLDIDRSVSFRLVPRFYKPDCGGYYYGFFLWWSFWIWIPMNLKRNIDRT